MSNKQDINQILDNNLMSKSEILEYIKDDFKVDLQGLKKVVIHKRYTVNKNDQSLKIPHHRYLLFFDKKSSTLNIAPKEGVLRIKHIKLEVECIERILSTKIEFEEMEHDNLEQESERVSKQIISAVGKNNVNGIIVGSLWNFNFFVNMKVRPCFLKEMVGLLDQKGLHVYIDYRIKLMIIEELAINGILSLNSEELAIFKEGNLPTIGDLRKVDEIADKIKNLEELVKKKKADDNIILYLTVDYIFFNDLHNQTDLFSKTTDFPETKIFKDIFLSFQVLKIDKQVYVNLPWANPIAIASVVEKLIKKNPIKSLFMYGKCGSLSNVIKVGQLITPNSIEYKNEQIVFKNSFSKISQVSFTSVDSPLLETHTWLLDETQRNIKCVEMELFPILKVLNKKIKKYIVYYVSDNPNGKFKLSNRFEFLDQRLKCVNKILTEIMITKDESNKSTEGLVGFVIQNVQQKNQEMVSDVLKSNIDFLHIDISDGFAGIKSDVATTHDLLNRISKISKDMPVQIHFFVSNEENYVKFTKLLDLDSHCNILKFIHVNRDNYTNFSKELLDNPNIYFGIDVRDILNDSLPIKIYQKAQLIICLQSKEEESRIDNFDIAIERIRQINKEAILTVDRSVDYDTLKKIKKARGLNVVAGSYLKKDLTKGYSLLKSLIN